MKKIENYIGKNWIRLNVVFITLIILLQLFKNRIIKPNDIVNVDVINFSFIGILLFVFAIILLIILVYYFNRFKYYHIIIITALAYTSSVYGYILQKDPNLEWRDLDVPLYNHSAAEESAKYGVIYLISTWNARANPYDKEGYNPTSDKLPYSVKEYASQFVNKYSLNWLIGNNWAVSNNLKVNKYNNRPYMHPPFAPIIMGYWLKIFPFGRWSINGFMILINLICFALIFWYLKNNSDTNGFCNLTILLAIITSPVLLIYYDPSAEQITMLLTCISVIILLRTKPTNFVFPLLSGIFIGLAFYTKFLIVFYMFFQTIFLLFSIKRISIKPFGGYIVGFLMVNLFFILLDYYFWLTYITGQAVTKVYLANHPHSFFTNASKLLYFGFPLIAISLYLINYSRKNMASIDYIIIFPLILGLIVSLLFAFELGAVGRYLSVFIIALSPFLLEASKKLQLSKMQIAFIPISNLLLLLLIMFL